MQNPSPRQVYTDLGNMTAELRYDCIHCAGEAFDSKHGCQQETSSHDPFTEAHTHAHISTPSFRVKDNGLGELDNIELFNISGPPCLYHPEKSSSSRSVSLPIPHIANALATSLSVLHGRESFPGLAIFGRAYV